MNVQVSALKQEVSSIKNEVALVKGTIHVSPLSYYRSMFVIKSDMRNVKLRGDFREAGNTDFYTYVFDDLNFQNWAASADSKAIYSSGKVVVGKISLNIAIPGTYYVVFSNKHSLFTSKNVEAAIYLEFEGKS